MRAMHALTDRQPHTRARATGTQAQAARSDRSDAQSTPHHAIQRMLPARCLRLCGSLALLPLHRAPPAAQQQRWRLLSISSSSHGDGERVCGMVIVHRHGERAPMVNFYRSDGAF